MGSVVARVFEELRVIFKKVNLSASIYCMHFFIAKEWKEESVLLKQRVFLQLVVFVLVLCGRPCILLIIFWP